MLLIKAFHIIAMVAWFAGLFYLPRLFVYHADSTDSISHERFKIMERRLYYGIMAPAAILTIGLGIWLLSYNFLGYLQMGWMQTKLSLVCALLLFHGYCGFLRKKFAINQNIHSAKFYRYLNEFPTIILIAVIILTVLKPTIFY
ncbi:MAG: protoporphyrinogen oxidase HemJ [Gammaproteobacteria bacterium]